MAKDISTTAGQKPVEDWSLPAIEPAAWPVPAHWHVFPCVPNEKRPLTPNGVLDATNDPAQIAAWREQWPDANWAVACGPSGLAVADIDGPVGEASWSDFERVHGLAPATLTVRTRSGGRHLYFEGKARNSAGTLGPKLDVRGTGGYVLLPGSAVDGKPYTVATDHPIAALPYDLSPPQRERRTAYPNVQWDTPEYIARARGIVDKTSPADEGERNDRAYKLAARLFDLPLSAQTVDGFMADWNERCDAPLDDDELATVIWSAERNRQNDVGCDAAGPAAKGKRRFKWLDEDAQGALSDPEWLVEGFLVDRENNAIHADYDNMKSFIANEVRMSVETGEPFVGKFKVRRPGPVIYAAAEGVTGLAKLRRPAWRVARKIAPDRKLPDIIIPAVPHVESQADIDGFLATIDEAVEKGLAGKKPVLVIFDPLSRSMKGLDANSEGDAGRYIDMLDAVRERYQCATLVLAHDAKQSGQIRGSSVFTNDIDNVWKAEGDRASLTAKLEVDRLKEGGAETIHMVGREIALPGERRSLVFDWAPEDEYNMTVARKGTGSVGVSYAEFARVISKAPGRRFMTSHIAEGIAIARQVAGRPDVDVESIRRDLDRKKQKVPFKNYVTPVQTGDHGIMFSWPVVEDATSFN